MPAQLSEGTATVGHSAQVLIRERESWFWMNRPNNGSHYKIDVKQSNHALRERWKRLLCRFRMIWSSYGMSVTGSHLCVRQDRADGKTADVLRSLLKKSAS